MELQTCPRTYPLGAKPTPLSVFIEIYYNRYQDIKKNRPIEPVVPMANAGFYPHGVRLSEMRQRVENNEWESLQKIQTGPESSPYFVKGENDIAALIRSAIEYGSESSLAVLAEKIEDPEHVYEPPIDRELNNSKSVGSYEEHYQMIWWNWLYLKDLGLYPEKRMDAAILAAYCQARKDEENKK